MLKQQMAASTYHLKLAEVKKLFIAAPTFRDRCVIKSLFWLGLRREEIVRLDTRDIDFERKRVVVRRGKGGKTRVIPIIDEECLSDLKHLIGGHTEGPVFPSNQRRTLSLRLVNTIVESFKTKMDMYRTISIDEMQEIAERKLSE